MSIDDIARSLHYVLDTLPIRSLSDAANLLNEATQNLQPIATTSCDPDITHAYELWQQAAHDIHHARTACEKTSDQIAKYKNSKLGASYVSRDTNDNRVSRSGRRLSRNSQKAISSFEKQISAHEEKLARYKEDPYAYDNTGRLTNETDSSVRNEIYHGRVRRLEKEIQRFRANIKKVYDEGL